MKKLLIVVDYQVDFVSGTLGFEGAEKLTDVIKEKIESYISNNHDIIYTLDTHYQDYLDTYEGKHLPVKHCIKGSMGHELVKDIDYRNNAIQVFEKNTFPSLELGIYLKDKNYDEVELCGLVSNICVISNAIIVKSALPNAHIVIDALATDSFDKALQEKCFDVLQGLQISVINR